MNDWKLPELELPESLREEEEAFTRLLKKRLRRSFVQLGLAVGAAVLALVAAGAFWLPRLENRFFYNPAEESKGRPVIEEDMDLYAELFRPELYGCSARVQSLGEAEYEICLQTPSGSVYKALLIRNGFLMAESEPLQELSFSELQSASFQEGEKLNALFRLKEPLPMEELWQLWQKALSGSGAALCAEEASLWCALYREEDGGAEAEPGPGAFVRLPPEASPAEAEAYLRLRILSLLNGLAARRSFLDAIGSARAEEILRFSPLKADEPLRISSFRAEGSAQLLLTLAELCGVRPACALSE